MNPISWTIFAGSITAFALVIMPVVALAQNVTSQNASQNTTSQNITSPQKPGTKAIINWSDHTVRIINMTTNETISVRNFTFNPGNITGNQTTTAGNQTTTAGNQTGPSLPNLTAKASENQTLDLTSKMKALQTGK